MDKMKNKSHANLLEETTNYILNNLHRDMRENQINQHKKAVFKRSKEDK